MYIHKNIFDIINEAEEDEQANKPASSETETSSEDNKSEENNSTDNSETTSSEENIEDTGSEDTTDDEDFSIDTNLDEDDSDVDDNSNSSTDDSGSSDTSSSDSSSDESDEPPVEANTDIFSSLTAEEQKIKIKELKRLYNEMYVSTSDILSRINQLNCDEYLETLSRISAIMYNVRNHIHHYIINIFDTKSYIENDVTFNRFLSIIKSITTIIDNLASLKEEKIGI